MQLFSWTGNRSEVHGACGQGLPARHSLRGSAGDASGPGSQPHPSSVPWLPALQERRAEGGQTTHGTERISEALPGLGAHGPPSSAWGRGEAARSSALPSLVGCPHGFRVKLIWRKRRRPLSCTPESVTFSAAVCYKKGGDAERSVPHLCRPESG